MLKGAIRRTVITLGPEDLGARVRVIWRERERAVYVSEESWRRGRERVLGEGLTAAGSKSGG